MKTFAVHFHLYYLEQLPEVLVYLKSLENLSYDLFVTMPKENEVVEKQIKNFNPDTKIFIVNNWGYDIGPFISFLHQVKLDEYKYILKIHTKGNKSNNHAYLNGKRLDNKLWKRILFDALLKNQERVRKNLDILDNRSEIGMLSSAYCVTSETKKYWKLLPQINQQLKECGFDAVDKLSFVAGTMFYVRSKLLKPLLKYSISDFDKTDGTIKEGTLAHVMERLFGALVLVQGYTIHGIKHDSYKKGFILASIKHFLFRKKKTKKGDLIKICKIPVYSRKERK